MTKEELLTLNPYEASINDEDVYLGIELFSDDADNEAAYAEGYSVFQGVVVNTFSHKYYHELHVINKRYLANLEAREIKNTRFISFLYIKEAEYFQSFNAYAESLRNVMRAMEVDEDMLPSYRAAALNIAVDALWNCDLYAESEKYMKKMEDLMVDESIPPVFRFTLGCNLMNAFAILGNREKSEYYYNVVKDYTPDEVGDNFFCFLDIFRLSDEARFNFGKIPSDEYLANLKKAFAYIVPGNGIEEDYFKLFLPIFNYVRGFINDNTLVEVCKKLIDTTYSLPDKINLYKFMFEEFGMTKVSEPKLYAKYYEALESHYRMISETRKHEITNEILNEELAAKYKISAGSDSLTGLGNRYSYDNDINELSVKLWLPDDLYILMMDLNGLKGVNDYLGRDAGDEFIKGAGDCISNAIGNRGKVYRVGGDEFMAIVYSSPDTIREIVERIDNNAANWKGKYATSLSISTGFSETRDVVALGNETIKERLDKMRKIADHRMYEAKKAYYERTGKDRRK
ncbi:MAG: GGDEF domain-containing protein [Lachnospiraceae bacterium]|nr:GGDEF domain-containing protein [Lachnospiraceae bacterium]